MGLYIFLAVLAVIIAILCSCIKIVPQTYEYVIVTEQMLIRNIITEFTEL